jgi:putative transposase
MARRLKGASAHRVRHEMWERVREKLWGDSFWSDGYFYRSVGSTTAESVRYYVENSQRKHWMKRDHEAQGKDEEEERQQQARLDEF